MNYRLCVAYLLFSVLHELYARLPVFDLILFWRWWQNFITRDDIIAYAEEGGDFAQLKEVDACMEVRCIVTGWAQRKHPTSV